MNDRKNTGKKQILILVEGKHEKEILLRMLLRLYPEIPVKQENIHIYESDLYDLYHSIEREYGSDWDAEELEIDIPKLISMRHKIDPPLDGRKFTDIFLMFDFERHDNWYTDEKVIRLQNYFSSELDHGFLFINYPMIEAYQHMATIPDPDYLTKSVPVSFGETVNYGAKYKSLAKENSCIVKYLDFYEKCLDTISQKMTDESEASSESIVFQILSLSNMNSLLADIDTILTDNNFEPTVINFLKYYLKVQIEAMSYIGQ